MTSWSTPTKNTTSYSEQAQASPTVTWEAGSSIGLLLCITRGEQQSSSGLSWSEQTRN